MTKEKLINNILFKMNMLIDKDQMIMLESVLQNELYNVDVTEMETGLSTGTDTNEYFIQMMLFKMNKKLSPKTVYQYERCIKSFCDFINKSFDRVNSMDIEVYLSKFAAGKNKSNSNKSLNNERRYLSACFKWMRKANLITINPCENVEPFKEIQKPIDHLVGIEVEQLRDYCKTLRERDLVEFLLSTACRVGEAERVKISDLDMQVNKNVLLYGSKGSAYRYACLGDAARYHIKKYLDSRNDDSDALFVTERGIKHGVTAGTMRDILKSIKKRAEIGRSIYPHLLRKTSATDLRNHGAAIEDISVMLGHKDASTTIKFYAAVSQEHISAVHSRCSSY